MGMNNSVTRVWRGMTREPAKRVRGAPAMKRCLACGLPRRHPNELVCSPCWAQLPRSLKDAFVGAPDQKAKQQPAAKILEFLGRKDVQAVMSDEGRD